MATADEQGKAAAPPASVAPTRSVLVPSHVSKADDLGLVFPFVAGDTHEWGETTVWPDSAASSSLVRFAYTLCLHNIYVGPVPLFSAFFYAILSHYQIRAVHL
ncbi:hypothetical protein D1007_30936 [Hordeum vulgare]|nr:hypothetical protein D1007_30936 [Hordeum vulgare]